MKDFRSDTVTLPTPEMKQAIFDAELGDDVYGEDPTVNELERLSAEIFGKEDAVLVSTGTMGNLVSILSHCQRGEQIIIGDKCHIYRAEAGGIASLGGIAIDETWRPRTESNPPTSWTEGLLPLLKSSRRIFSIESFLNGSSN